MVASQNGLLRRRLTWAQAAQEEVVLGWHMFQMYFVMHALFQISNSFRPKPPSDLEQVMASQATLAPLWSRLVPF